MNVYIILVNFNGFKLTKDCINSIYNSKFSEKYDVNIVVVDNGSKVNENKRLKKIYPKITYIRSEKNLGFAAGNNLGIKKAMAKGGDYFLLINNDTVLDKFMLGNLLKNARQDMVLSCKMLYYDKPDVIWCEGGYIDWKKGNSYNGNIDKKDVHNTKNFYCDFTSGCCMLIPKKIIKKIGLLREDYFMYYEDTEYCLRLKQARFKIMIVPQSILYHKVSASSGGDTTPFSTYYMTRNRLEMIKEYKNMFKFFALSFSLITRYMRMIQFYLKGDKNSEAIKYGIDDFKHKKIGQMNYPNLGI